MKPPKTEYVIYGRLGPRDRWREIEHNSRFADQDVAKAFAGKWVLASAGISPKVKPEARVETELLPHLADCVNCMTALYKGDIAYSMPGRKWCFDCASKLPMTGGYVEMLDEPKPEMVVP